MSPNLSHFSILVRMTIVVTWLKLEFKGKEEAFPRLNQGHGELHEVRFHIHKEKL